MIWGCRQMLGCVCAIFLVNENNLPQNLSLSSDKSKRNHQRTKGKSSFNLLKTPPNIFKPPEKDKQETNVWIPKLTRFTTKNHQNKIHQKQTSCYKRLRNIEKSSQIKTKAHRRNKKNSSMVKQKIITKQIRANKHKLLLYYLFLLNIYIYIIKKKKKTPLASKTHPDSASAFRRQGSETPQQGTAPSALGTRQGFTTT